MIDGHDEAKPAGDQPQYKTRYDGLAKVTGKARYAAEFSSPFPKDDLVYARIV
jgi:xanthine dehydrogenase YagR molybdenum-binding subunit